MTDAEVVINGKPTGPKHHGAFYRFKYDITDAVTFGGPNRLELSVSKYSEIESVNAAERRGDYWNYGGIFREVMGDKGVTMIPEGRMVFRDMSVEENLIVPVIREAQSKSLGQIVTALADLTERARNRRLKPTAQGHGRI